MTKSERRTFLEQGIRWFPSAEWWAGPDACGRCTVIGLDSVLGYRVENVGMRSNELATCAGVNVQTLRYYERRGLLMSPPRSSSGYRAYPTEAVAVVRFVKRAQDHGFTLEEIGVLLDLAEGGPDDCELARELAEARMVQLAERIADLQRMQQSLSQLVATCELPRSDRSCPLLHTLHDDKEGQR